MYAKTYENVNGQDIIIYHVFPPVPIRNWDYQAGFAKDYGEEDAIYGEGATIQEAIQDLFDKKEFYEDV
jgi:hypothetical protein